MTRPMVDILSRNSLVPSSTPSQATNLSPTISIRIFKLVEKTVRERLTTLYWQSLEGIKSLFSYVLKY